MPIGLDPKIEGAYFNLGNALFIRKRYDEASSNFRKATNSDPRDGLAFTGWGDTLQAQGRHDEAIAMFKRADELSHSQPK